MKPFLFLLCISVSCLLTAQTPLEDSLKNQLKQVVTDEDKMLTLASLSMYYMGVNGPLSDQYGKQIIEVAETSRNRELMVKAYLYNARRCYDFNGSQESVSKGVVFSNKALELARNSKLDDCIAASYASVARGLRSNGENAKALANSNLAVSLAVNSKDDSIKVLAYTSLGDTYLAMNEKMLAFRNYLMAYDLAEQDERYTLLRSSYASLSDFYGSINDYEKAKDFEFKKEQLQRKNNKRYDLLQTYLSLGTLYRYAKEYDLAEKFYEKSIALADTLKFELFKLNCYLQLVNLYLSNNQFERALAYFDSHKELKDFIKKAGMDFLVYQAYGSMYTFLNKFDSAAHYFKLAEPGFEQRSTKATRYWFYSTYAYYFNKTGDYDQGITYWLKAKQLGDDLGNLDYLQYSTQNLDSLYQKKGDFKNAYFYGNLYNLYKDSLQKMGREKDLMSLEIDNENRRKEREARAEEVRLERSHNIQYMGMVVAIAIIFILLVMAGFFKVSKTSIKIMGFFAFIFLFEFIILLADHQIHSWTHGEPWKVMAIKILLIAMLLPLHHWLEDKVIHYLTSQNRLQTHGKHLVDKWLRRKKPPIVTENI
jgi:tetratricopeptide (TPR) repeat protein